MTYRSEAEARSARQAARAKALADARKELESITARRGDDAARAEALAKRIADLEKDGDNAPDATSARPTQPDAPIARSRVRRFFGTVGRIAILLVGVGVVGQCCVCVLDEAGCNAFDRRVDLRWNARVTSSTGVNLPVGTACAVRATVWTEEDERKIDQAVVRLTCAGRTLFEFDRDYSGLQISQASAPGGWRYGFLCNETSDDDEHLQFVTYGVAAGAARGRADLVRSGRPGFRVGLEIARASDVWRGEPAFVPEAPPPDPGFLDRVERPGTVASVQGRAPVKIGDACVLRVRPIRTRLHNCRVRLDCAGRSLYDSHTSCVARQGRPRTSDDTSTVEAGPALRMDLDGGTATVREEAPGLPFSAEVRLTP